MKWRDSAPSNIALIKYMGKDDAGQNIGSNPSLSLTLENLRTEVELEIASLDAWQPFIGDDPIAEKAQERFLRFFRLLKDEFAIRENFTLRSRNNFPSDAGIASSASSFAALTKTALRAFSEIRGETPPSALQMARWSRRGSGSSCRSFFGPWCSWNGADLIAQERCSLGPITDFVLVVEGKAKTVSSSEAHKRVKTSPLFISRRDRAEDRMHKALEALKRGDWNGLFKISWSEFWDMHSLFHTSEPSFRYLKPGTLEILDWVEDYWQKNATGPIATIDAGPNVHLLVAQKDQDVYRRAIQELAQRLNAKVYQS